MTMHLGVILSMKNGMEHFIYREVSDLANRGATISVFPCKHRAGLYNPRPEWHYYPWRAWRVVLSQPLRFLSMPLRYLSALWMAIRHRDLVDFMLAAYFAPHMKNVDVIYSTFGDRKLFVGYFSKLLLNKPLSVTIHSSEMYFNPNVRLFKVALAACDQIVSVTEHNRLQLAERYGVDRQRVEVVRLSVDLDQYRPAKKFVILIVAMFGETKGHEILFKALKELGNEDMEVWVVGGHDGREPVNVQDLAKQIGVEAQVAFFGKLSGAALSAVYHACDVFCLPCRRDSEGGSEGFPAVLIEAMAYGKPVVTTRHTEIPRVVEQIIVPENDVRALADALQLVYNSAALRRQLGLRNRELAEMHFSSRNLMRKMRLLQQIASPERADFQCDVREGEHVAPETVDQQQGETAAASPAAPSLECQLR
jgi:glycosyltransferase involved in cell wall biosynthesis